MRHTIRAWAGLAAVVVAAAFVAGYLLRGAGEAPAPAGTPAQEQAAEVWTCSMHPQIRLSQPGKCPICFMDLIPVPRGTDADEEEGERRLTMTESAVKLAGIETTPVRRRHVHARIRTVGEIAPDETRLADIAAWVPGRIERLYVNYTGAEVRRGDPLAEVYSSQLVSAQEELVQALRAFEAVASGERTVAAVSGDRTATAGSDAHAMEAEHGVRIATAGPGNRAVAATLESVREKLRLLGMTDRQIESVERSGQAQRQVVTHAPSAGVVVEVAVREGQYVQTGARLLRIADLSRVWVIMRAYQSELPLIRTGQEINFTATALPGADFSGTVEFVDPVLDPKTMTAGVRAVAQNRDGRLKPGMYVSGEIHAAVSADGAVATGPKPAEQLPLVIPATAPLLTGTRAVVYVRLPGERPAFEGREVVLGPRVGEDYVVLEGLAEGELVVTAGAFKIDSELQIRARPSMMNPEGGVSPAAHAHGDHAGAAQAGGARAADGYIGPAPAGVPGKPGAVPAHEHEKAAPGDSHRDTAIAAPGDSHRDTTTAAGAAALEALMPLYEAYFEVQMALAGDDLATATAAYTRVRKTAGAVDMSLFTGSVHDEWMGISATIANHAGAGAGAADIAAARDVFFHLSRAMIDLEEKIGHTGGDFWLTFCPMARDNTGAFWIQQVDTVYNSFYGHVMLRCGSIEKRLPPMEHGD